MRCFQSQIKGLNPKNRIKVMNIFQFDHVVSINLNGVRITPNGRLRKSASVNLIKCKKRKLNIRRILIYPASLPSESAQQVYW